MVRPRSILVGLAVVALLATSGCAQVLGFRDWLDVRGHKARLENSQKKYVRLLRWGEYGSAAYLVSEDLREEWLEEVKGFSEVRFADYDVIDTDINELQTEAEILVKYEAYHLARLVTYGWSERQVWKRDITTGAWTVTPDLEKLRSALVVMAPSQAAR